MKVAFVTETWTPSVDGVVTRLTATIRQLERMGHGTLVVAPDAGGGTDGAVTVPSVGIPFLADGKPWGLPLTRRVTAIVEAFRPDLVHAVNPFILGTAAVRAARRLGLPLVASFHQDIAAVAAHYRLGFLAPGIWAHVRHQHATAALNLATSRAAAAELEAHGLRRVGLWPYGVDADRFHPARPARAAGRDVTAVYVGRLAPEKDLDRLIPLAHTPGLRLVVVGDGPLRPRLERAMAGPGVRFTGWLAGDDLVDAYLGADVFVFPSTTETLGMVLIEAMACGLPVIAAASPTSAELLGDSGAGVLIAEEGWPGVATVVADVGQRTPVWRRRSEAAAARAAGWSWGRSTEALVGRYEEVLRAAGRLPHTWPLEPPASGTA